MPSQSRMAAFALALSGALLVLATVGAERASAACASQQWARSYDNATLQGNVAFDPTGGLIVAGSFDKSIDFGLGPIASAGNTDMYVARVDPTTGAASWAFGYGESTGDQEGVSVATDPTGH